MAIKVKTCRAASLEHEPPGVFSDDERVPLYQALARWGWGLGRPFCRDEVAKVFGVAPKKAGNVMSYLRRARPDVVESRQHYEREGQRGRKRFMRIVSEPRLEGRPSKAVPVHLATSSDVEALAELRRWFISRR